MCAIVEEIQEAGTLPKVQRGLGAMFMLNALEAACEEEGQERGMGKKCIQQNINLGSYGPVDGLRTRRLVGTDQFSGVARGGANVKFS